MTRPTISTVVKNQLWGIAAGRCEICNEPLYKDQMYSEAGNSANIAHIQAVNEGGSRHNCDLSEDELNDISNLMLLCYAHHHLVDQNPEKYPIEYLLRLKKEHEDRIERVTSIPNSSQCEIIKYLVNIDSTDIFHAEDTMRRALLSVNKYSGVQQVVDLARGCNTYTNETKDKEYYDKQAKLLERATTRNIGNNIENSESLGVFALGPQPLFIKLGTLLSDQNSVYVFQPHRGKDKWTWPTESEDIQFELNRTRNQSETNIALVVDLSASVTDDRIIEVLGDNCTIYHLTIENPNREFVQSVAIQNQFVKKFRETMELLKDNYSEALSINLFPVMPASLNVRLGMDWMSRSDKSLKIYDQNNEQEGFFEALKIGE